MVLNGTELLHKAPVNPMFMSKLKHESGTSFGLGEAGYDIRIKQQIEFIQNKVFIGEPIIDKNDSFSWTIRKGRFCIVSSIEEFHMPDNLVAIVHDKSTWARQGLSVFNTVIEPGWKGYLTLELVYHGEKDLIIPAGSGIAQVVFHQLSIPANYAGKYQNQPDHPVASIWQKEE